MTHEAFIRSEIQRRLLRLLELDIAVGLRIAQMFYALDQREQTTTLRLVKRAG